MNWTVDLLTLKALGVMSDTLVKFEHNVSNQTEVIIWK